MTAQTPGQAAFAAYWTRPAGTTLRMPDSWDELPECCHDDWEAAAAAARKPLRDAVAALGARLDASADATRPSRKSEIERECAAAVRQILEET